MSLKYASFIYIIIIIIIIYLFSYLFQFMYGFVYVVDIADHFLWLVQC